MTDSPIYQSLQPTPLSPSPAPCNGLHISCGCEHRPNLTVLGMTEWRDVKGQKHPVCISEIIKYASNFDPGMHCVCHACFAALTRFRLQGCFFLLPASPWQLPQSAT